MFGKSEKEDCPFWRGPCRESKCRFWVHLLGKDPQSNATIDAFGCSFEFLPKLLLENSQQTRQTCASIDRFNEDMVRMNGIVSAVQAAPPALPHAPSQTLLADPQTDREG